MQQIREEDIYYCYRRFLEREPNELEWSNWHALMADREISVQWLIDSFLDSVEYKLIHGEIQENQLIQLEEMKIYIQPGDWAVGGHIAQNRIWEPHVTHALKSLLRPDATFIDIGANIGYFTLLAASCVGTEGRVIAFEPNPNNCDLLTRSIEANGFRNIQVHRYAVAEYAGAFVLLTDFPESNGHIISCLRAIGQTGKNLHVVGSVVLDEFLANIERIDVVKLDIEGAEPKAVLGMRQLLASHRPILITEFNPTAIEQTSQVPAVSYLDQLVELGFDLFILDRTEAGPTTPQSKEAILQASFESSPPYLELLAMPN